MGGLGSGFPSLSVFTGLPVSSLSLSCLLYNTVRSSVLLGDEPLLVPALCKVMGVRVSLLFFAVGVPCC